MMLGGSSCAYTETLQLHAFLLLSVLQVAVQQQQQQPEELNNQKAPPFISSSSSSSSSSNPAKQQQQTAAKQKHLLVCEYVSLSSSMAPQPPHGAAGQVHAVWNHKLHRSEKQILATGRTLSDTQQTQHACVVQQNAMYDKALHH